MNNPQAVSPFALVLHKGQSQYRLPQTGLPLEQGAVLIVETSRGLEFGRLVISENPNCAKKKNEIFIKSVLRVATDADLAAIETLKADENNFYRAARKWAPQFNGLVSVRQCHLMFDRKHLFVYYLIQENAPPEKVQAKVHELQRLVQKEFSIKTQLKEVNQRSLAKVVGGIGSCGMCLCCSTYITRPKTVSVKMAKNQNLAINMAKLTGQCGKLKCCLRYELENYVTTTNPEPEKQNSQNAKEV